MVVRDIIKVLLLSLLFRFLCSVSFAEPYRELSFILQMRPIETVLEKKDNNFFDNEFLYMIRLYQLFISAQDKPTCMFEPSCSQFANVAIGKYGFFYGALMTLDRLQRCNGLGINYYKIDSKTGRAYDPVDKYLLIFR